MTTEIHKTLFAICRKYCGGIEYCPNDEFCDYLKEIKRNIVKIIVKSNTVDDED